MVGDYKSHTSISVLRQGVKDTCQTSSCKKNSCADSSQQWQQSAAVLGRNLNNRTKRL